MRSFMAWVRPALAGLTTRGRSFLAAGIASAACSLILGQRDLLRVGSLLVVLPIGCALVLGRARYRLALTRTINPGRVTAGGTARVRLELENMTFTATRVLLAEDRVPFSLGASPRFVLARLPGGTRAAVTYSVRSLARGRYPIGPVRLRLADPFGMCEITRSFTATDPLVVVPRTWPLPSIRGGGLWSGTGESVARSAAASGEDDIATREYRHGDDLRRVHWRSTARRGEIMVRREEQPRQMRATVLLDNRADNHRGEGPASSLEWAVSVAASAAVSLTAQRYGVRLLLEEAPAVWTSPYSGDAAALMLDQLAVAEPGGPEVLAGALTSLSRTGGDGFVVAVLGEVDDEVAAVLSRVRGRGTQAVAVLARTTAWTTLPPTRSAELDATRARVAATLREAGWAVVDVGPADPVPLVWARALGLPDAVAAGARPVAGWPMGGVPGDGVPVGGVPVPGVPVGAPAPAAAPGPAGSAGSAAPGSNGTSHPSNGTPHPGQPYQGQPYPGQPYRGQAYPGNGANGPFGAYSNGASGNGTHGNGNGAHGGPDGNGPNGTAAGVGGTR